jgi:SAM-dependent methyltransferase
MADWFEDWFDEDYALLYAHRDAEEAQLALATALQVAPELTTGPVLDLGCGAGRHLEVLRRTNPAAFGMDLSGTLLGLAPAELRPWLLRGDMRRVPVREGSLAGICLWFTPFGYFSDAGNRDLLRHLSRLLQPGGVLVLDYLHAPRVLRDLVAEDTMERSGISVRSHRTLEGERLVKRMTLTRLATGESREALESVHLYQPGQLEAMGAAAGLRLRTARGSYAGGPLVPDSPRWIGIFEKPAGNPR